MPEFVKCGNPHCINRFERIKKGGYWKRFCNSKCRSMFHSGTSSKYSTPHMLGVAGAGIGATIQHTVNNQVNNAIGRVGGTVTSQIVDQVQNTMNTLGVPTPKFTIGGVVLSQLIANLFKVNSNSTRMILAKWIGGFGLLFDFAIWKFSGGQKALAAPQQVQVQQHQNQSREHEINSIANVARQGGFVSAKNYRSIEISTIPMSGEYDYLFGMPSRDFYMVLHGLPGNGKTTFAVKFAQYFNQNHGRVLYLASEQNGIDLSLQEILKEQKATFQIHTKPKQLTDTDLLTAFKSFDLIVLDSATNLGLYPSQVKKLHEESGKALISILQSNKDGGFKGSQEWLHDVDVSIRIDDFKAQLEKTRYKTTTKKIPTKGTTIPI